MLIHTNEHGDMVTFGKGERAVIKVIYSNKDRMEYRPYSKKLLNLLIASYSLRPEVHHYKTKQKSCIFYGEQGGIVLEIKTLTLEQFLHEKIICNGSAEIS